MDQVWARNHVLTTVKRATMAGEPLTAQEVCQRGGLGPQDAQVALGILADEGKVREQGGVWTAVDEEEAPPPEMLENGNGVVGAPAGEEPAAQQAPPLSPEMVEAVARHLAGQHAPQGPVEPKRVTLQAGIVEVLQPEVLGAMLLAGVADAKAAGAVFEFVVEP